jgi:hypothetical protein
MEITYLTLTFNISNDNRVFMDVIEVPSLLIKQEIASVSLMEIGWMQYELSGGCACDLCIVDYSYSRSDTEFLSGGSTEMTGKISNHSTVTPQFTPCQMCACPIMGTISL